MTDQPVKMSFPKTFWTANFIELFERFAFYAMYISLTFYLTKLVHFTDVEMGFIVGTFSSVLYLLPLITGALADKLSFKRTLIIAFIGLVAGYLLMGIVLTKLTTIIALGFIAIGGAFFKPTLSGTIGKTTTKDNSAKGFSIFYMVINIGGFLGKTAAYPLRINLGEQYICMFAALLAFIGLMLVIVLYKNPDQAGEGKSIRDTLIAIGKVMLNIRFMIMILIISGFWLIFIQLYATIPLYTTRTLGEKISPEWMVNINPGMIAIFQLLITALLKKWKPVYAMAFGFVFVSAEMLVFSIGPSVLIISLGIACGAFGEMCLSPRFLEFVSQMAPRGEQGLYMGFSFLPNFFGNLFGGILSGYLLEKYCPQGGPFPQTEIIWYTFAAIGAGCGVALLFYQYILNRIDHPDKRRIKPV